MQAMDRKRAYVDLRAVIDWTRTQSANPAIVMLGICFGGPYALSAAADGLVQGVVTWHGSRMENFLQRSAEMRCPMRMHFGSVDPIVPMSAVEAVRAAFSGRQDAQVIVHEGATHGFSHRTAPAYDVNAERAGMSSLHELIR
jgi:carboxymethylenebutenolidase